jgi:hypothetical protein
LFCAGGYCAANTPIPWEVFYRFTGAEAGQGQTGVDRELGALDDLGLVKLAEAEAVIHPLLAEASKRPRRKGGVRGRTIFRTLLVRQPPYGVVSHL